MFRCKICGDKITLAEKRRGTCSVCETTVAKVMFQKTGQKLFSRKYRTTSKISLL